MFAKILPGNKRWAFCLMGICALILFSVAPAGATDIANEPLISMPASKAKPNAMFILDDSITMGYKYMPDSIAGTGYYGYRSSQCNGVAYDPKVSYIVPPNGSFPTPGFRAAYSDAYTSLNSSTQDDLQTGGDYADYVTIFAKQNVATGTGDKTFDVSSSTGLYDKVFVPGNTVVIKYGNGNTHTMTGTVKSWTYGSDTSAKLVVSVASASGSISSKGTWYIYPGSYYYSYGGAQPALSWSYNTYGVPDYTTTFYKECTSVPTLAPGKDVFSKTYVSATSADAQNYAIWYSYYRTRLNLMRSAVGVAFDSLDSNYRIGFTAISNTSLTEGTKFRDVADFDASHKSDFYSTIYNTDSTGVTPLRRSLSMVGRYYAKKYTAQTYDPMQYSCQRNFAILTTDGFWNSLDGQELDGGAMENLDATESRPMYDGTTTYRTKYDVAANPGTKCPTIACVSNYYCVTSTPQIFSPTNVAWTNNGASTNLCWYKNAALVIDGPDQTASSLAGTSAYYTTASFYGSSALESLADTAEYYYTTDLRTPALGNCTSTTSGSSQDVCLNNIPSADRDTSTAQHMTTFTIGLGVSGSLTYDKNYLTQTSGDYVGLKNGTVNWPTPSNDPAKIDDLWHAAVNGRGKYYSALNTIDLKMAIQDILNSIQESTGAGSGGATNTTRLAGDDTNRIYETSYTTGSWVGELAAYKIDGSTLAVSDVKEWSAQSLLDSVAYDSRKIYFNSNGKLADFTYDNLPLDQQAYFSNLCSKALIASQCLTLSADNLKSANDGSVLVNYLRGQRDKEQTGVFRTRKHVLGDIINSQPVYVGKPLLNYTDSDYSTFKTAQKNRKPMVYVGANDGMLHAFVAATGVVAAGNELWAFVPTAVMPNLYKLANESYANKHNYFVNGTPAVADIYDGSNWRTILVGGLEAGGKAYYALDVTDPDNPSLLWEFADTNLGLTYGNPLVTKLKDGTWVVLVTSGYNNTTGDGKGHLYVLNAVSGTKLFDISTGQGSSTEPSGLAQINGWVDNISDNTVKRVYGGDLLGNLWRFDIDNLYEPKQGALLLARFLTTSGVAQPITIKPRLKAISSVPVVFVGTGRYLGLTDVADTTVQTVAAVKDPLTNTAWGSIRSNSDFVKQTITVAADDTTATISSNAVDWSLNGGWWMDLPHSGERVATGMELSSSKLYFATAIPSSDVCTTGGTSWIYSVALTSGAGGGDLYSRNALIAGFSMLTNSNGDLYVLAKGTDGKNLPPLAGGGGGGGTGDTPQRTSWRELAQ